MRPTLASWSEVPFAKFEQTLRLDAEYYRPEFLQYEERVAERGGSLLAYITDVFQPPEFIREYVDSADGAIFWRAQNIRSGYISTEKVEYIDESIYNSIPKAHVSEGDILITRTGANAGDCAVVPQGTNGVAISSHTLRLIPKTVELGYVIGIFFASNLGKEILLRTISGSSRPQITKEILLSISLPDFTYIATDIANRVREVNNKRRQAVALEGEAKEFLSQELGLDSINTSHQSTYTAMFNESAEALRLDAEFFQPKYRNIIEHLSSKYAVEKIGQWGKVLKGRSVSAYQPTGVPVIRSGDLSDIHDVDELKFADTSENLFYLQRGDICISSIGFGSIGKVQVFDIPGVFATVSEVTVVRQNRVNPYYLQVYLQSSPGQLQIERWVTGATGQLHLYPRDVEKILVPVLPAHKQDYFEEVILRSRQIKSEAEQLLENTKLFVERFALKEE